MRALTPIFLVSSLVLLALACCTAAAPEGYTATPVGYILSDCVRDIPSGATVQERDADILITRVDGTSYTLPHCDRRGRSLFAPRDSSSLLRDNEHLRGQEQGNSEGPLGAYLGWTQYTAYQNPAGDIRSFLGYFTVPDRPAKRPEVLYLFTGLQNIDWIPVVDPEPQGDFDIIQPVLQYPNSFQDEWAVRSWYVTLKAGALASDPVPCNPGDVIFGNMTRTGDQSYYIGSTVVRTGATTVTNANNSRLKSQPWAYNTLECYGCSGCRTYPTQPSKFTQLALRGANNQVVTPTWVANPKPSRNEQCKEAVKIYGPSAVDIIFNGNDDAE